MKPVALRVPPSQRSGVSGFRSYLLRTNSLHCRWRARSVWWLLSRTHSKRFEELSCQMIWCLAGVSTHFTLTWAPRPPPSVFPLFVLIFLTYTSILTSCFPPFFSFLSSCFSLSVLSFVLLLSLSLTLFCSFLLLALVYIHIFLYSEVVLSLIGDKVMHDLCLNTVAKQTVFIMKHGHSSAVRRNCNFYNFD